MRTVGIKVLKNKLSEYVRLASSGETVLVTDRDRVVAELVPPRPGRADRVSDAVLAEGVRDGWITPRRYGSRRDGSGRSGGDREGNGTDGALPDGALPGTLSGGGRPLADILADLDDDRADR